MAGDASARRYCRLGKPNGETALLVEYPPALRHQLVRDLEVREWCRERGLRVPEVLASDPSSGWAVIEDLGTVDGEAALAASGSGEGRALVARMLEPLALLAACDPDRLPSWNPPLDRHRLRWELAGFELWFVRHLSSTAPRPELGRWLDALAEDVAGHPRRVCHRDYHLNNLLVQPDGAIAIIDEQDLLIGPDTYDVVSLLTERAALGLIPTFDRDAALELWARRVEARPGWRERANAVRLQRGLKVLGTFARLAIAGRPGYRQWLVELRRSLAAVAEGAGADPVLTALLLD